MIEFMLIVSKKIEMRFIIQFVMITKLNKWKDQFIIFKIHLDLALMNQKKLKMIKLLFFMGIKIIKTILFHQKNHKLVYKRIKLIKKSNHLHQLNLIKNIPFTALIKTNRQQYLKRVFYNQEKILKTQLYYNFCF